MLDRLTLAAALAAVGTMAGAATLDFTELGTGTVPGNIASVTGATLITTGDALFVGSRVENSICALDSLAFSCANDLAILFEDVVSNLSFIARGIDPGDFVEVFVYGLDSVLLGSVDLVSDEVVDLGIDLSSFGSITSLYFDDSSEGFGADYSDFSFEVAAVPVPAALPLLAAGLGGLALVRRRPRA